MKVELESTAVRGFRFAGVSAGLKTKAGALDLGLIAADRPAAAAAVFSANRVKAAPVYVTADRARTQECATHASLQAVKKYPQPGIACVTSRLGNLLEGDSKPPGLVQTAGQPRQRLGPA